MWGAKFRFSTPRGPLLQVGPAGAVAPVLILAQGYWPLQPGPVEMLRQPSQGLCWVGGKVQACRNAFDHQPGNGCCCPHPLTKAMEHEALPLVFLCHTLRWGASREGRGAIPGNPRQKLGLQTARPLPPQPEPMREGQPSLNCTQGNS